MTTILLMHLKGTISQLNPAISQSQGKRKIVRDSKWPKKHSQEKLFQFESEGVRVINLR